MNTFIAAPRFQLNSSCVFGVRPSGYNLVLRMKPEYRTRSTPKIQGRQTPDKEHRMTRWFASDTPSPSAVLLLKHHLTVLLAHRQDKH